jgi:hypothetical protein
VTWNDPASANGWWARWPVLLQADGTIKAYVLFYLTGAQASAQ